MPLRHTRQISATHERPMKRCRLPFVRRRICRGASRMTPEAESAWITMNVVVMALRQNR